MWYFYGKFLTFPSHVTLFIYHGRIYQYVTYTKNGAVTQSISFLRPKGELHTLIHIQQQHSKDTTHVNREVKSPRDERCNHYPISWWRFCYMSSVRISTNKQTVDYRYRRSCTADGVSVQGRCCLAERRGKSQRKSLVLRLKNARRGGWLDTRSLAPDAIDWGKYSWRCCVV